MAASPPKKRNTHRTIVLVHTGLRSSLLLDLPTRCLMIGLGIKTPLPLE